MPAWVIPQALARSCRPGYSGERGRLVSIAEVDAWIAEVRALGIKSIVCLLAGDQLPALFGEQAQQLEGLWLQADDVAVFHQLLGLVGDFEHAEAEHPRGGRFEG